MTEQSAALPAHLPPDAYLLVETLDDAFGRLIGSAPTEAKVLSFQLYRAALAVAVRGDITAVSQDLRKRALAWGAQHDKLARDERESFHTAHIVDHSTKPKSREGGRDTETAFDEAARALNVSPRTAEKRYYSRRRKK